MLRIGCQLSCARGYLAMGRQAVAIGANTFQFFTRNPRGGAARALDLDDMRAFTAFANEHDIHQVLGHAPYVVNPCSAKEDLREFASRVLREDIGRLAHIPGSMYVLHPGSHVGQGLETGIRLISEAVRKALAETEDVPILLETMSRKGTVIGGAFEHLRDLLDAAQGDARVGVCLDTCHVHDAGYDICEDLDGTLSHFDEVVGLRRLRAVHVNDSMNPPGTRRDRHEGIGKGHIGLEAIMRVVTHPRLRGLPFYLETPNDLDGYAAEISLIREEYGRRVEDRE